jgi:predicted phage replisome organizer
MADVKWIKITTDIFDDEKILLIENLPDAYAIITVWFKLLCLAGKQNNSGVFLMGRIPYTDKMLATIFRMKESTVTLALQTFEQFGMIELIDGVITIPNWNKHQTLDAYEKKKERDRLYQAERRATQRALVEKSSDSNTTQSSDVAISDKEVKQEKEVNKDLLTTTTTGEAPSLTEVYVYFKGLVDDASKEADKFHAYNANKGWTCLPNWKAAADLWIARIEEKGK